MCKAGMGMQQDCSVELPPGFRFHPTDEELVSYYLTRKISNVRFEVRAIGEVDLNKCEPWDLPGTQSLSTLLAMDCEWVWMRSDADCWCWCWCWCW
jgi:hypothetical protein